MLQPGSGLAGRADDYRWWAADNGCFSQGAAFDVGPWFSWLASLPHVGRRRRLFAVAPDVLGDVPATVQDGKPAARAGIKAGDIITAVNGKPTPTLDDLQTVLAGLAPGQEATLDVTRVDGAEQSYKLTLGTL
jgi:membrane-associated protease RseP (regulator of RpoE activity)